MAKRALLSRLSRLELPGRKPPKDDESAAAKKHSLASLELKAGDQTRRIPSPKAVREEKVKLEKIKKVASREKALRIIEKFREKEKIDRANERDLNFRSEEADELQRQENAIREMDKIWRIARIAWRLVFGSTMIYFGLRGVFNLIGFLMNPPARARPFAINTVWVGIAFMVAGWLFQWGRKKLVEYEGYSWGPYARAVLLAWIPMVIMTATGFLSGLIPPTAEAFLRLGYVYLYVTLFACWYYFLTVV